MPYPKWRIWMEGLLIIAAGACMAVTVYAMFQYDRYGAFYDESWRDPSVEDHFFFEARGNRALEAAWKDDGDAYDWDGSKVVLVKLGCEDCERVADAIYRLQDEGYTVVFSRSGLGRAYTERYAVDYVPSVIAGGTVIQLRSGASMVRPDKSPGLDGMTDGEAAREILDGLAGDPGFDPASDPDYTKYGTKAALEAAMEELERQAAAGDPGTAGP